MFMKILKYWSTYKENALLTDLYYCDNKKFYRNNAGISVEYKWSLWQRVASSENETSESSKDNFSTSKPVDMFDSNLSQLCRVDRPSPFFPFLQTLATKWPITTKSRFLLKNSTDHGSCPEEFGSLLFADENTNSEMFRAIPTRLWQPSSFCRLLSLTEFFSTPCSGIIYQIMLLSCIFNIIQTFKLFVLFYKVTTPWQANRLVVIFYIAAERVATQGKRLENCINDRKKFSNEKRLSFYAVK